jgi:hypothetical protein
MIPKIIKVIITVFLVAVCVSLIMLWLVFGTILLITLLFRLIVLYTIALLNNSVSGTPLTHDYNTAINEVVEMYIDKYIKFIAIPKLPWVEIESSSNKGFKAISLKELEMLKKSWIITIIVFISYLVSFSLPLALVVSKNKKMDEQQIQNEINSYKSEIKIEMDSMLNELEIMRSKHETLKGEYLEAVEFIKKYSRDYHIRRYFGKSEKEIDSILNN